MKNKKIIYLIVGISAIGVIIYQFFVKEKIDSSVNYVASDAVSDEISEETKKTINDNGISTTNSATTTGYDKAQNPTITGSNVPIISITNTMITLARLSGQNNRMQATIKIINQPVLGSMLITIDDVVQANVALPINNGIYDFNKYLYNKYPADYKLSVKIGEIVKTVQVKA